MGRYTNCLSDKSKRRGEQIQACVWGGGGISRVQLFARAVTRKLKERDKSPSRLIKRGLRDTGEVTAVQFKYETRHDRKPTVNIPSPS